MDLNKIKIKKGKFIKYWDSATVAAKYLGLLKTSINNCLRGNSKISGGFKWGYQ